MMTLDGLSFFFRSGFEVNIQADQDGIVVDITGETGKKRIYIEQFNNEEKKGVNLRILENFSDKPEIITLLEEFFESEEVNNDQAKNRPTNSTDPITTDVRILPIDS